MSDYRTVGLSIRYAKVWDYRTVGLSIRTRGNRGCAQRTVPQGLILKSEAFIFHFSYKVNVFLNIIQFETMKIWPKRTTYILRLFWRQKYGNSTNNIVERTYEGISLIVVNFIAFELYLQICSSPVLKVGIRTPIPVELQELMSLVKTRKDHVTLIIAKKVASSNPLISFCPS